MKSISFFFLFSYSLFSQIQIGNSLNGEAMGDNFGDRVAISSNGSIMIVGSKYSDYNTLNCGGATVYRYTSNSWVQIGNRFYGQSDNESTGKSVAISSDGNIIAFSANGNNVNGISSGAVHIYQNVNDNWTLIGQPIYGLGIGYLSGQSISLSSDGSIIAISAQGNNQNGSINGQVRVFKNIANIWTQVGQNLNGANLGDNFGYEVSLSSDGSKLAVSSIDHDANGIASGQVRVFENVSNVWTQIGQNLNGNNTQDQFGRNIRLSASGETLIVGATGSDVNGMNSGTVSVYKYQSNNWDQIGTPIHGEIYSGFGWGIAISGDANVIAVGAPSAVSNYGIVKLFKNTSNTWNQIGVTLQGDNYGDNFGNYVDLSDDGTTLAVGAWGSDANGSNSGQVKVYTISALLSSDVFISNNFSIYPNPASNTLNINVRENLIFEKATIYNSLGQSIDIKTSKIIDIKDLSKGTYFIEVVTDKGKATKTFIKE